MLNGWGTPTRLFLEVFKMKVVCLKNLSVKSGEFLAGQEVDLDKDFAESLIARGLAKGKEEKVSETKEEVSEPVVAPNKKGKHGKK